MTLAGPLIGAGITAACAIMVFVLTRWNQKRDRSEDRAREAEREAHNRHVQRYSEDLKDALKLLDSVLGVATELMETPATKDRLDELEVPKLITQLDILGDKLEDEPAIKEKVCTLWGRLDFINANPVHFGYRDEDLEALYSHSVVLNLFVSPAKIQVREASEIYHHIRECREAIRQLWSPK